MTETTTISSPGTAARPSDVIAGSSSAYESHFQYFRERTIGFDARIQTPFGSKPLVYADWIASGRLYRPIEQLISEEIGPFMANTHTENSSTGLLMTEAYQKARARIKKHVGAHEQDVLIAAHSGMTGLVNKFQRLLGLRVHERHRPHLERLHPQRPVVFVTHMEHHSNQTSWVECMVDVVVIPPAENGLPDLGAFADLLKKYEDRPQKMAAITSCSNLTGVLTPYREIARMMHRAGGLCFVDFAASAPYIDIVMRPEDDPEGHLDAIFFSPHKFLGGPGSSGVLVFCPKLYQNRIPDNPGGGTVDWTNPWGEHKYLDSIEAREDGGTPSILQTIKAALAIELKEQMGVRAILEREHAMLDFVFAQLEGLDGIEIMAHHLRERIGAVSFATHTIHYNQMVQVLNDQFGIQLRAGCHCAGTYGHYLMKIHDRASSKELTDAIERGDLSRKPGWVRLSLHPTMSWDELVYICDAIRMVSESPARFLKEYQLLGRPGDKPSGAHAHAGLVEHWLSLPS